MSRIVKGSMNIGFANYDREIEFEVDDDMTYDDIDSMFYEEVLSYLDWGYDIMSRIVKGSMNIGFANCDKEFEFEVGDDATDDEIEEMVYEEVLSYLDWGYEIEGE